MFLNRTTLVRLMILVQVTIVVIALALSTLMTTRVEVILGEHTTTTLSAFIVAAIALEVSLMIIATVSVKIEMSTDSNT